MTTLELAEAQMKGLRCSYPPYVVAQVSPEGWPVAALPGNTYELLERGFAPTAEQAKITLCRLRQKLRWSRSCMAAFMGVSQSVLRRWETGQRNPSGAARRLIWLLDILANQPDALKSALDLVVWGKGAECMATFEQVAKM
ncbi:MAG: helix-turn-helix domain-containing protein [Verrucomicrobiia bacterium]